MSKTENAARVLRHFSQRPGETLAIKTVADDLGMPPSTVHSIIAREGPAAGVVKIGRGMAKATGKPAANGAEPPPPLGTCMLIEYVGPAGDEAQLWRTENGGLIVTRPLRIK